MKKKCNARVKHTCGSTTYATCVNYEGTVNENSELADASCLDIEETTQDIYSQLEQLNLSDLGKECLEYEKDDKNKIKLISVLLTYEKEICKLKEELETAKNTAFCELLIKDCGLDLKCLELPCEQEIATVRDLFQALIDKQCDYV